LGKRLFWNMNPVSQSRNFRASHFHLPFQYRFQNFRNFRNFPPLTCLNFLVMRPRVLNFLRCQHFPRCPCLHCRSRRPYLCQFQNCRNFRHCPPLTCLNFQVGHPRTLNFLRCPHCQHLVFHRCRSRRHCHFRFRNFRNFLKCQSRICRTLWKSQLK